MAKITAKGLRWIPGFEGTYKVSACGRIFSMLSRRWLKAYPDTKRGYLGTWLYANGKRTYMAVHRAVALAFVSGDSSLTVNHLDHDKTNNEASNLEWVSNAENIRHSFRRKSRRAVQLAAAKIRKVNLNNTSGNKGVSYRPSHGPKGAWVAYVMREGKLRTKTFGCARLGYTHSRALALSWRLGQAKALGFNC